MTKYNKTFGDEQSGICIDYYVAFKLPFRCVKCGVQTLLFQNRVQNVLLFD